MKYPIIFSMLFFSSTFLVNVSAQTNEQNQSTTDNPHKRNGTERQAEHPKETLTPEQRAQKQADALQKKLGLTEEQKKQAYDLNLARINQSSALREKNKGNNKQGSKEEFQKIKTDYDQGLTNILTDDQQKTWAQLKADAKAKRDAHHAQKGQNNHKPVNEDTDNQDVD